MVKIKNKNRQDQGIKIKPAQDRENEDTVEVESLRLKQDCQIELVSQLMLRGTFISWVFHVLSLFFIFV
jgi:hypothetical protein